jgi:hypothetical protein
VKWKLTGRYLVSVLIIVFIVILINTVILIGMFIHQQGQGMDDVSSHSGEVFSRHFYKYLVMENGQPAVSEEGMEALQSFGAWIQILDANGNVVTSSLAPEHAPDHYSP